MNNDMKAFVTAYNQNTAIQPYQPAGGHVADKPQVKKDSCEISQQPEQGGYDLKALRGKFINEGLTPDEVKFVEQERKKEEAATTAPKPKPEILINNKFKMIGTLNPTEKPEPQIINSLLSNKISENNYPIETKLKEITNNDKTKGYSQIMTDAQLKAEQIAREGEMKAAADLNRRLNAQYGEKVGDILATGTLEAELKAREQEQILGEQLDRRLNELEKMRIQYSDQFETMQSCFKRVMDDMYELQEAQSKKIFDNNFPSIPMVGSKKWLDEERTKQLKVMDQRWMNIIKS